LGCAFCTAQEYTHIKPTTPSVEEFLVSPFGYQPTKDNFKHHLNYRMKVYTLKNKISPQLRDTFVKFTKRASNLVVLIDQSGEHFLGGKIVDSKIQLMNGIHVNMSRYEFFRSFSNLKTLSTDTVEVFAIGQPNQFRFVFKDNLLHSILIGLPKSKTKK
jgi:hypothetical protein